MSDITIQSPDAVFAAIRNNDAKTLKTAVVATEWNPAVDLPNHLWYLATQAIHEDADRCLSYLLADCGVSPDAKTPDDIVLINLAASRDKPACLRVLINANAQLGCALAAAAAWNSQDCVAILIAAGATIETPNKSFDTPLTLALQQTSAYGCAIENVVQLLDAGASLDITGSRRFPRAIDQAIQFGSEASIELVISELRARTRAHLSGNYICGDLGLPSAVVSEIMRWL